MPTRFFELMLGPRLKYSCCLFPEPSTSVADAEVAMLHAFCGSTSHSSGSSLSGDRSGFSTSAVGGAHGGYVLDNYDDVRDVPVQQRHPAGLHQGAKRPSRRTIPPT